MHSHRIYTREYGWLIIVGLLRLCVCVRVFVPPGGKFACGPVRARARINLRPSVSYRDVRGTGVLVAGKTGMPTLTR